MNSTDQKNYKRLERGRGVPPDVAAKISASLKKYNEQHPRSDEVKKRQSDGLKRYWDSIPQKNQDKTEHATIEDIML